MLQCFAFADHTLIAHGEVTEVVSAARRRLSDDPPDRLAIYNAVTGHPIDFDLRGTEAEVIARLVDHPAVLEATPEPPQKRGRGRPKLGVVSREVSLLPRHWDWLSQQRGGASATLRRLVEAARKAAGDTEQQKQAVNAAYSFMSDLVGNQPGFENASRALFAHDFDGFEITIAQWPEDVRDRLLVFIAAARGGP
ncbi:MAG: DUF2239 family protein [Bradymonadia bacterium]